MTSIAEPNSVSWMARRSDSFVAQAYISSMVFGGLADVEAAERPCGTLAPSDQFGHAHDGVGAVLLGEVGHEFHGVAVEDHGLFAGFADVDRHDVGVDGGQGVQAEVLGDLAGGGELHRPGDLVAEAVDELDGGGHAAGVGVGLEA